MIVIIVFRFSVALTPSPSDPLPLEGKGEAVLRGGFAPSFLFSPLEEANLTGRLRGADAPLSISSPSPRRRGGYRG